jgi:phosphotransferase system HPr (HPr) family protein
MKTLRIKVVNAVGLHARPAAMFVQAANSFGAGIQVRNATAESAWVDGKSILGVLTLGVEKDHEVEIRADGADEEAAVAKLENLIATDFA